MAVSVPSWLAWMMSAVVLNESFAPACLGFGLVGICLFTFVIMFVPKSRQLSAIGKEGIYLEDHVTDPVDRFSFRSNDPNNYSPSFYHFRPSKSSVPRHAAGSIRKESRPESPYFKAGNSYTGNIVPIKSSLGHQVLKNYATAQVFIDLCEWFHRQLLPSHRLIPHALHIFRRTFSQKNCTNIGNTTILAFQVVKQEGKKALNIESVNIVTYFCRSLPKASGGPEHLHFIIRPRQIQICQPQCVLLQDCWLSHRIYLLNLSHS